MWALCLLAPLGIAASLGAASEDDPGWADGPATLVRSEGRAGGARIDLAGSWALLVDPGATGMTDGWAQDLSAGRVPPSAPGELLRLPVPGPLEALDQTVTYDGVAWLAHAFELLPDDAPEGSLWRLRFDQVNYHARAWVDGVEVGEHEGGYEAFTLELGALAPGRHVLVLRVLDPGEVPTDGMTLATTPHAKESWYHNFGGVLGDVELQRVDRPVAELTWLEVDAEAERLRADVTVVGPPAAVSADVRLTVVLLPSHPDGEETVVTRKAIQVPLQDGRATAQLSAELEDGQRWSPETPQLYQARVSVGTEAPNPEGQRSFGLRSLSLGPDGLALDGRPRRLHGVLWQPHFAGTGGMLPSDQELIGELHAMREAGFNLVRAHVRPAPPALLDAADRVGMLVLEEPAIGWVDDDPALAGRLTAEVDAMLARDHHHPSIVMWGVLNELSGKAYRHGHELMAQVHAVDPTRPVLLDSGGFFGRAAYLDAGPGGEPRPMADEHLYPPYPLPPEAREQLSTVAATAGPTFVSEFGTGALVDAMGAWDGFSARAMRSEEARLYAGQAAGSARALAAAHAWTTTGWLDASRGLQAAAALEMIELLRGNPALDMLCYTQWRAVSSESSAGLLEPWGWRRPAIDAVRHSLRPLMARVEPARRSGRVGQALASELVVVNDTATTWTAEALIECVGLSTAEGLTVVTLPAQAFEPGVTRLPLPELRLGVAGTARLRPTLLTSGRVVEAGSEQRVEVLADPPSPRELRVVSQDAASLSQVPVRLFDPVGDEALAAFAARQGFELSHVAAGEGRAVAVLCDPQTLAERLALPERVALWRHVESGGEALVLLSDPTQRTFSRLVAGARGQQLLVDIPVDVAVAAAGGNFMGRVYPLLEARDPGDPGGLMAPAFAAGDGGMPGLPPRGVVHASRPSPDPSPHVRLLAPDEGLLTPVAMLVGELPPGSRPLMLAVGSLGDRIGVPVVAVPFGLGRIVFVGQPLMQPVDGEPDARRDDMLSHLIMEAAADGLWTRLQASDPVEPRGVAALDPAEAVAMEQGMAAVRRYVDLADRFSLLGGSAAEVPADAQAAVHSMHAALQALARGHLGPAREQMLAAFTRCHDQTIAGFLALEQRVLEGVFALRASTDEADLLTAHDAISAWERGVSEWFTGDRDLALSWMGRADLTLSESGRLP